MTQTLEQKRNYKALFILNTRGYEEPVENLHTLLSDALKGLGAEVGEINNLGRKDFSRVTEKDHLGDTYVEVPFSATPNVPNDLQEALRLERRVKRVMVELA